MFFDPRRYDLAKVGRYKFNKKLPLQEPHQGARFPAEDVVDETTGEILAEDWHFKIDKDLATTPCRTQLFRML